MTDGEPTVRVHLHVRTSRTGVAALDTLGDDEHATRSEVARAAMAVGMAHREEVVRLLRSRKAV